MAFHIVLLEPEIPQNTGNIARTCAASKAVLHLIHPLGFRVDEKEIKRAGLDYWHLVTVREYPGLAAFLQEHADKALWFCTTKAEKTYADVKYGSEAWFVFGKESAGLPEELLVEHRKKCIRIPMADEARSLNLSNAAAVVLYEALRQTGFDQLKTDGELHRLKWE
jgi:tRNA (cytidine/uridine-2'-O-)-methyltransferase